MPAHLFEFVNQRLASSMALVVPMNQMVRPGRRDAGVYFDWFDSIRNSL
jgi:hypothetical protein